MADTVDSSEHGARSWWAQLSTGAKWSFGGGAVLIVFLAIIILWWATRTDYQMLFANLEESDAGAVVQELKQQKIPYRLTNEGHTINVPADRVYETRLALMTSGKPLTGGVGFEIFDRQSLGATEQSQRVAYQRALQGELSRTIGALEHVRQARVLLVLPESTLFKRDQQKARAAVSLVLESGQHLESEQIAGVQRLVAGSVGGLDVAQVVITDQRGVTLSAPDASSLEPAATGTRLKLKNDFEQYITQKITAMLTRVVGPGQAIISVDATLNFDQISRTLQAVVPLDSSDGNKDGGVLHRRESHARSLGNGDDTVNSATNRNGNDTTSIDVEYEFGKRVEQVVAAPGALVRLSVGVIVPGALTAERESRLLQLVRVAAGVDTARGDMVVIDSLDRIASPDVVATHPTATNQTAIVQSPSNGAPLQSVKNTLRSPIALSMITVIFAALLVSVGGAVFWMRRGSHLSTHARQALLDDIVAALDGSKADASRRI